jgi:hypothetical protein
MHTPFVQFSSADIAALPTGYCLVLHVNERIATLMGPECIRAQCRFPQSAFRLLFLLLRSPHGANYAELLACLRCSEPLFHRLLTTRSHEDLLTILAPQIDRWHRHLEQSAKQGRAVLERELKVVRRALKEAHGLNAFLQNNGFTLKVEVMYRKGYLLTGVPATPRHR